MALYVSAPAWRHPDSDYLVGFRPGIVFMERWVVETLTSAALQVLLPPGITLWQRTMCPGFTRSAVVVTDQPVGVVHERSET